MRRSPRIHGALDHYGAVASAQPPPPPPAAPAAVEPVPVAQVKSEPRTDSSCEPVDKAKDPQDHDHPNLAEEEARPANLLPALKPKVQPNFKLIIWNDFDDNFLVLLQGTKTPIWIPYSDYIEESPLLKHYMAHMFNFEKWILAFNFIDLEPGWYIERENDLLGAIEARFPAFLAQNKGYLDEKAEKKRFKGIFPYMRKFIKMPDQDDRLWRLHHGYCYYAYLGLKFEEKKTGDADVQFGAEQYRLMLKYTATDSQKVYAIKAAIEEDEQ